MLKHKYLIRILCVALVLLPNIYPITWHANEYAYFGLAKQHISPDQNSMLYAVNNHQFSRFVTDYTIGVFVKYFGFDTAWVILRFIVLLALSVSIAFLTTILEISLIPTLLALVIFRQLGQTYFAGEWLVAGVEAKTFAYPLVLFGFGYVLKNNFQKAAICFSLASYFHFLVGGFWGTAIFSYAYFATGRNNQVFRYFFYYILSFVPILFMVQYENYKLPPPDLTGIENTINQIYSNIRHPHHLAPFKGGRLSSSWVYGLVFIVLNTGVLFSIKTFNLSRNNKFIVWLMFLHLYLLFALVFAFFDRNTQYFGKFYLFRPAALTLLLTLLIFSDLVIRRVMAIKKMPLVLSSMLAIAILIPIAKKIPAISYRFGLTEYDMLSANEKELINWLKGNTDAGDVVLFEEGKDTTLNVANFEQIVERPTLVTWKFVPITNYDIARWYKLVQLKKKAYLGDCSAFQKLSANYSVAISDKTYNDINKCGRTVYVAGGLKVIEHIALQNSH